jgi:hypothetical protein
MLSGYHKFFYCRLSKAEKVLNWDICLYDGEAIENVRSVCNLKEVVYNLFFFKVIYYIMYLLSKSLGRNS